MGRSVVFVIFGLALPYVLVFCANCKYIQFLIRLNIQWHLVILGSRRHFYAALRFPLGRDVSKMFLHSEQVSAVILTLGEWEQQRIRIYNDDWIY